MAPYHETGVTVGESVFQDKFPGRFASIKKLVQAKQTFEYRNDAAAALALAREARILSPETGHLSLMEAMLLIRNNRFTDAQVALLGALKADMSDHGQTLAHYYLGRVYANRRDQTEATAHLEAVTLASQAGTALQTAAAVALGKVKSAGFYPLHWHEVIPQFQFGDSQTY